MPKRILSGTVVYNKQDKTIKVNVDRRIRHQKYKKIIKRSKKYSVHDANNEYNVGDNVLIQESRPLSKSKRWIVLNLVKESKKENKENKEKGV